MITGKEGEVMVSAALVGQVIQSYRLRKGMSQEVLSGLAGLDRTHYSKIERGLRSPTLDTLLKSHRRWIFRPAISSGKLSSKYQSTPNHNFMGGKPVEQKIKQDSIRIGRIYAASVWLNTSSSPSWCSCCSWRAST